jgi:hypothetical protein
MVQVVKMRMGDLLVGDVINKNPDEPRGWFTVHELQDLPNNGLAVLASTSKNSINGSPDDIVGVQVRQTVELPETQMYRDHVAAEAAAQAAEAAEAAAEAAPATAEAPRAPQPDVAPPAAA